LRSRRPLAGIDHLDLFFAEVVLDDRLTGFGVVEEGLEHLIFVGVHGALDDVLAKAPGGVDQHDLVEAGFGVDGEHHARAAMSERTINCTPIDSATFSWSKPLMVAVGDRPVGEQRGIAAPAGGQQRLRRAH
jgi:hypothetical protein